MQRFGEVLFLFGAFLVAAGFVVGQEADLREATSPFQEEFDFRIGQTLELELRIDGLRWAVLRAGAGDSEDWTTGKKVKTYFTNELENLTDMPLTMSAIILLEDERGRQLERVELKRIRVGGGRYIEDIQKIKIDGGTLSETAKIYIFAEVK